MTDPDSPRSHVSDILIHLVLTLFTRRAQQILPVCGAALVFAVTAPEAHARTASLHLFSRQTSSTFTTPQGKPLPPNTPPAAGDVSDSTDLDYIGTDKHHAKTPIGSDHLRCTIISFAATGSTAVCDGQIAIGGSMLLVNHETVALSDTAQLIFQINGGTGTYRHAHGKLITTTIGNTSNSDFDIKINY
jgi:hypothetical protein